jgi:putative spermidine/putrescine transport system permease protein
MTESTLPAPILAVRQRRLRTKSILRWITLILLSIWLVVPFVPMLLWSFSFRWTFPDLLPESWSLQGWEYVVSPTSQVVPAIIDSAVIAIWVTFLSLLIAIPAGRALGLYRFKGKRFVEFMILAPNIVPGLTVVLGIHIAFIRYGLADTMLGVILVHLVSSMTYAVLVMAGVFANYNPEFEEQSRTLGANRFQTFFFVTLPSIAPGLVVAGLFAFLISWFQYVLTIIIAGGFVNTLSILVVAAASGGNRAITGALSIVFVAPAIIVLFITSKYLTGENATVGGLGGI